jgi:hypothetical protein
MNNPQEITIGHKNSKVQIPYPHEYYLVNARDRYQAAGSV